MQLNCDKFVSKLHFSSSRHIPAPHTPSAPKSANIPFPVTLAYAASPRMTYIISKGSSTLLVVSSFHSNDISEKIHSGTLGGTQFRNPI